MLRAHRCLYICIKRLGSDWVVWRFQCANPNSHYFALNFCVKHKVYAQRTISSPILHLWVVCSSLSHYLSLHSWIACSSLSHSLPESLRICPFAVESPTRPCTAALGIRPGTAVICRTGIPSRDWKIIFTNIQIKCREDYESPKKKRGKKSHVV